MRHLKCTVGSSWAAGAAGKEAKGKGMVVLLSRVGFRVSGGRSDAKGRGDDAANSTAPGSDDTEVAMGKTDVAPGARGENTHRICVLSEQGCLRLFPHI